MDPLPVLLSSTFAGRCGWRSNLIPWLIPKMIPRVIPLG